MNVVRYLNFFLRLVENSEYLSGEVPELAEWAALEMR